MKKMVILIALVALLVPSFVFAGGRDHGYNGYNNHRGGHNDYRHGGRIGGNDLRDAALIGCTAIVINSFINALNPYPHVVVQQPYQPTTPMMCTRQVNYGYWTHDMYGNSYWVTTRIGHEYVPCPPRF